MKKIVTLFIISIVANYNISTLLAQVPTAPGSYQWVKGFGSANQMNGSDEQIRTMKLDNAGNIVVCGRIMGYPHIQGLGGKKDTMINNRWQNANNFHGYISKYDCNGNLLWYKELNDSINNTDIYDFVIDSLDNIYFLGRCPLALDNIYFGDSLIQESTFNPPPLYVGPSILAKVDKNGHMKWFWAAPNWLPDVYILEPGRAPEHNGTVNPNTMILWNDTIHILSYAGGSSGPMTFYGVTTQTGINISRFTTSGKLVDASLLHVNNNPVNGFGIDKDGNYIASVNFYGTVNQFLDSTFSRSTASQFNPLSTIIKFNRHHVIRHIEFGDSTACYNGDFSNLSNGLNLKGKGRTGLKMYGNYTLKTKSAVWGANTYSNAVLHFEDLSNYKWTACADSSYSMGGFNTSTQDVNGGIYTDVAFNQYLKYQNLVATTPPMGANSFLIKIKRTPEVIENRLPDFTILNPNTSSSYVRIQNFIIDKLGNIYMSGNLSNNQVIVGTDTAKYYGGNNDMFIIKYGNVCGNNMPMIAAGTPGGLVAKCNGTAISLSWQKLNNGEDKYYIYRSFAANSGFVKIDSVQPTINTYTDANVLSKTNYWYAISSHNIVGEGYLSQADSARLCDDTLGGFVGSVAAQYQLSVYPNPTKELLVVSCKSIVNTIAITNVVGQHQNVKVEKLNTNDFRLTTEYLPSGIYFIKATDINGNVWNGKFVKE